MSKWERPTQPPSPMFFGEKEKDFVKQVNDEIIERVVGQQVLYFPIDIESTDFHPIYGEAISQKKTYRRSKPFRKRRRLCSLWRNLL